MSDIVLEIQEMLEDGYEVDEIVNIMQVPVEWVDVVQRDYM
jgi:hypothetical protein